MFTFVFPLVVLWFLAMKLSVHVQIKSSVIFLCICASFCIFRDTEDFLPEESITLNKLYVSKPVGMLVPKFSSISDFLFFSFFSLASLVRVVLGFFLKKNACLAYKIVSLYSLMRYCH